MVNNVLACERIVCRTWLWSTRNSSAPSPKIEESTWTLNGLLRSGCMRDAIVYWIHFWFLENLSFRIVQIPWGPLFSINERVVLMMLSDFVREIADRSSLFWIHIRCFVEHPMFRICSLKVFDAIDMAST